MTVENVKLDKMFETENLFLCMLVSAVHYNLSAQQTTYEWLLTRQNQAVIQPTMYGLFFEDITLVLMEASRTHQERSFPPPVANGLENIRSGGFMG